jgi:hypothetical protein
MKTIDRILATAVAAAVGFVGAAAPAYAKLSADEVARLGADLTPVGAEKGANKDGTIPAWSGGLCSPPAGWAAAKGYTDPFASDKPKFVITKANMAQYRENLTPGTIALLEKNDAFKMPVYETRRTACYPDAVYQEVKSKAPALDLQGFGITGGRAAVPFPLPKSGLEVMWNHQQRYLGGGLDREYHSFPVRANGDYYRIGAREFRIFNANLDQPQDNLLLVFRSGFTAPATLEGTVFLVHEPLDQVKQSRSAWIYNAGQRRVRRAPDLAYDNFTDGTEGMRTSDQFDAWNGAPDRYDWKLIGKKEIYIPYNAYKLGDKSLKYKENIVRKGAPNPDLMRYELHRVWQVEANLKSGSKHIYGKRVFFVDEDTWTVVYEDAYDTRKQLWRIGVHPMMQFYDAKVPWYRANTWYDLNSGGYYFSGLDNESRTPWKFGQTGKWGDFQPDSLRRLGTK